MANDNPQGDNGNLASDNGNTAETGGGNAVSGWEIATGILSLGLISLGLGLYNHYQARKGMESAVKDLIRNQYDLLLTEKAEAKLKAAQPDQTFTDEEIKEAKYGLSQTEIDEATLGSENKRKVWDGVGQSLADTKEAFTKNVQNVWRISGGITAVGVITLAIALTIGTGGLGLGLSIGLGIVGALVVGWGSGKAAKASVNNSTDKFMSKCMDDPELRKGRTKEYEQGLTDKKDKLEGKVLHKGKGKGQEAEQVQAEVKKEKVAVEQQQEAAKDKPSSRVSHPAHDQKAITSSRSTGGQLTPFG